MVKKQTDKEEGVEAIYTGFEANSIPGLMTVVTVSNQKIKQLQEEKGIAVEVLIKKFKNAPKANLLAVRDNKDLDSDVRWAAGFVLSVEHNIRHNP